MSNQREIFHEKAKKIKRSQTDASSRMGRRPVLSPCGILNTITPCAACKLLRRRCAEECPFCPYFSPHEPHKFAAVHKVFGASSVSKMLMEVPESQRADAANSLVYEANLRLRDPVYGCMGAISTLQQQIQSLQLELNAVRSEILEYKYREATGNMIISSTQAAALVSSATALIPSGVVSISAPSPTLPSSVPSVPLWPPSLPPPPLPSIVISSSSSSSFTSSLYTSTTSTTGYSSVSSEHVPYFA